MLSENYLALKSVRLQPGQTWSLGGKGLAFLLPTASSGCYGWEARKEPLATGDLVVLRQDPGAKVVAAAGETMSVLCFSVLCEHLLPLFTAGEATLLRALTVSMKPRRFPASGRIARECHALLRDIPEPVNLDHRTRLLRVVSTVLDSEALTSNCSLNRSIRDEQVSQMLQKLSVSDIVQLTVPQLSKKFGFCRRHMNRVFQQNFGVSVSSLRMEMRLLKAVSLLLDPAVKVIAVAEQCGFNHLGLFNTCFKRRFGASPTEWRKSVLSGPGIPAGGAAIDGDCGMKFLGLCPWFKEHELRGQSACSSLRAASGQTSPDPLHPARLVPACARLSAA